MLTQYLASFVISTQPDMIMPSARQVAKLSLFDWLAVGMAGQREPVSRIVKDMVNAEGGTEECSVFGQQERLPARAAALANGTISHALDYDDTHFIYLGHPSVAVIPAAFAVAEKTGASFDEFLDAAVLAMESTCRIGAWLGREHYQKGFHQTATAGSFGSTLAASRLLGLDVDKTCYALGQTASRASGLKAQFGSMAKPYHAGMAASNGIESANLAKAGFTSCATAMEAEQGFAETHSAGFNDAAMAVNGLGSAWVFELVQHKYHACCHGTHASLEAISELRDDHSLSLQSVRELGITVHPRYLKVCNKMRPASGAEAKFSLGFTAAMKLAGYDTSSLDSFTHVICEDSALQDFAESVQIQTDDTLKETQARVAIVTHNGAELNNEYDLDDLMPFETRLQKLQQKASVLIGHSTQEKIWQNIENPSDDSMHVLSDAMVSATT